MIEKPMTVEQVASYLGVCRETVYRMINRKELGCVRRPGLIRVLPKHINDWETTFECPGPEKNPDSSDGKDDEPGTSGTATIGSLRVARMKAKRSKS